MALSDLTLAEYEGMLDTVNPFIEALRDARNRTAGAQAQLAVAQTELTAAQAAEATAKANADAEAERIRQVLNTAAGS